MAIAVAVAAFELSRVPQRSIGPILGGPKYRPAPWRSDLWYDEHVMLTCHKYPGCFEKGLASAFHDLKKTCGIE